MLSSLSAAAHSSVNVSSSLPLYESFLARRIPVWAVDFRLVVVLALDVLFALALLCLPLLSLLLLLLLLVFSAASDNDAFLFFEGEIGGEEMRATDVIFFARRGFAVFSSGVEGAVKLFEGSTAKNLSPSLSLPKVVPPPPAVSFFFGVLNTAFAFCVGPPPKGASK